MFIGLSYLTLLVSVISISSAYNIIEIFEIDDTEHANLKKSNDLNHMEKSDNVSVKLYYECMCPYCRQFDTKDLLPTLQDLAGYMDLKTFPYGNARMTKYDNGTVKFDCQHGPDECYGNLLHACALDLITDSKKALTYNGCMMSSDRTDAGSNDNAADECGKQLNIDSAPIKKCAKSSKGINLLKKIGEISEKVGFNYVPYVLMNGREFNSDSEDFKKAVCDELKTPPATCNNISL